MHLSIALFLGFAEIIAHETKGVGKKQSYKYVFWFEVGLATIALVLMMVFVRVEKAKSEMTADEKEKMIRRRRETAGL